MIELLANAADAAEMVGPGRVLEDRGRVGSVAPASIGTTLREHRVPG